jgi:hypothetical protein
MVDQKERLAKGMLKPRLIGLFDAWFAARTNLDSLSAGKLEFVDWVVSRICGVSDRAALADWYVLRAGHVRARLQQEAQNV